VGGKRKKSVKLEQFRETGALPMALFWQKRLTPEEVTVKVGVLREMRSQRELSKTVPGGERVENLSRGGEYGNCGGLMKKKGVGDLEGFAGRAKDLKEWAKKRG